jgi:hypothetical protein
MLPVPLSTIQGALVSMGDNVSRVGRVEQVGSECWQIECSCEGGARVCVACGASHGEDFRVFVKFMEDTGGVKGMRLPVLLYRCNSGECQLGAAVYVGFFAWRQCGWDFVLAKEATHLCCKRKRMGDDGECGGCGGSGGIGGSGRIVGYSDSESGNDVSNDSDSNDSDSSESNDSDSSESDESVQQRKQTRGAKAAKAAKVIAASVVKLTRPQMVDVGVPSRGQWFHRLKDAVEAWQEAGACGFVVGWDKNNTGAKVFGLYRSAQVFFDALGLHKGPRYGHEVLCEDTRVKLFLNIGWETDSADGDHVQITTILDTIRVWLESSGYRYPVLHTACSSRRLASGKFLYSYHVISPSVTFRNGYCCEIRSMVANLATVVSRTHLIACVDTSLYTRNRSMRMPHCCKFGDSVPFVRISDDSGRLLRLETARTRFPVTDPSSWKPLLVCENVKFIKK